MRAGYYAAGIGDPDHEEETRDQEKECKPPNYCPGGGTTGDGKEHKCPAGKFGNSNKLSSPACDGDCARGFFCTEGSDQNDENRCGREQAHPAAFYCPPGSSAASAVSTNKFTFCCAEINTNCPDSKRLSCPEDQRHYQGDCPTGFTCQNGKPVTIKWRDDNNLGMCYADNIDQPNVGQTTADVEEGKVGAVAHIPGVSFSDYPTPGIRALDGQSTIISTGADYMVNSEQCLEPASATSGHWETHFRASTNDVYLITTQALSYSGPGSCKKYRVVLRAVAGNANGVCTADINVKNTNDPPVWNPSMQFNLAIDERCKQIFFLFFPFDF